MSDASTPAVAYGSIISADLTVTNTEEILAFYQKVVGWSVEGLTLTDEDGTYEDYVVKNTNGDWVGGICHARGSNLGLPPVWLIYVPVPDLKASMAQVEALGGSIIKQATGDDGQIHYVVIRDPSGAAMALTPGA